MARQNLRAIVPKPHSQSYESSQKYQAWPTRDAYANGVLIVLYFQAIAAADSLNFVLETTSTPPLLIRKSSITKSSIAAALRPFHRRFQNASTILNELIVLIRSFYSVCRENQLHRLSAEALWMRDSRYATASPDFSETRESPSTRTIRDAPAPIAEAAQEVASMNRSG